MASLDSSSLPPLWSFFLDFKDYTRKNKKVTMYFQPRGAAQTLSLSLPRMYSQLCGNAAGIFTDSEEVGFLLLPPQNLGKESAVDQQVEYESL